jgi:hypothetical protein
MAELPQDYQPAADLDNGVQPEPNQRDRSGDRASSNRDDGLDQVVGDRGRGEQLRAAAEVPAPVGSST